MKLIYKIIFIGVVTLLFSGCATNRGVVALDAPVIDQVQKSNGKSVFINSVVDKRIFEVKPMMPNIPSLSPAEVNNPDIQARAIGRKRNTYGVAMGDILLEPGKTIQSVVRESVEEAFYEKGYLVVKNKKDVTPKTIIVDVKVNKLWSWMNPGFWAINIACEIETDLTIKTKKNPKVEVIRVNASDNFQTGIGSNYISVIKKARYFYISELKSRL